MKILINEKQFLRIPTLHEQVREMSNCSSSANNWKDLYSELVKRKPKLKGKPMLIVWGPSQKCVYTQDGENKVKEFNISTGANGFSNTEQNTNKTPTGLMIISDVINGKTKQVGNELKYEVLVNKTPTNKFLGPREDSTRVDDNGVKHTAEILAAILGLQGLEPCNTNVTSRNVYLHGTNREQYLGSARSGGCVRFSNKDIKWLSENLPQNTYVYIKA
jgi:hypothetical protein